MSRDVVSMIGLIVGAVVLVAACDNANKAAPANPMIPPPGDGSIVCPGGGACPKISAVETGWFGLYVPTGTTTPRAPHKKGSNPREIICPYDADFCPAGFTGRLLRSSDYPHVTLCKPGDKEDPVNPKPQCPTESFAFMCRYTEGGTNQPCPGHPAEQ